MELTLQEVNAKLTVKSVKGKQFAVPGGYYVMGNSHALYVPELGYMKFKFEPHIYTPYKSKKTLQSIIDYGGLTKLDDVEWVMPMKASN